jgi:von Willebrand factor type A domain
MILAAACVLSVLVSAAVFLLARRHAQTQRLPIGPVDPRGRRRRRIPGRLLYLGALALVAAVAGLLAWTVDGGVSNPPALPGETVLVIDLSGSITSQGDRVVARTLDSFHDYPPNRHAAVVYFSSSAAVGSPPSSPAADLSGLARLFTPSAARTRGPWGASFDGGTIISHAVALARSVLVRAQARRGRVVIVSDLQDNPKDLQRLHRQLVLLKETHARLDLMPLPPTRGSPLSLSQLSAPYRAVFGDHIIVPKPFLVASTNGRPLVHTELLRAMYPAAALLLALALGASALAVSFFPRLAWRLG